MEQEIKKLKHLAHKKKKKIKDLMNISSPTSMGSFPKRKDGEIVFDNDF